MGEGSTGQLSTHRTANQVLGLVVFVGGVALLLFVFVWAYALYQGINGEMFGAQPTVQQPQVAGTPPSKLPASGVVTARPGTSTPLLPAVAALLGKLLALLVLGWLAALLASKGAALALPSGRRE